MSRWPWYLRLVDNRRPPKRYVSLAGAAWITVPLLLVGFVILQNAVGVWPADPPVNVSVVIVDTVPGPATFGPDALARLEARVAQAAADSLRLRTRADSVTFYVFAGLATRHVSWDFRLLLLVIFMGALGAWVHTASSFVTFVGNRKFTSSWIAWYLLRPAVGAGMAVIFYMVLRTGLVTTGGDTVDALSHYSAAAFAGLVGLFSQKASDKLSDVFEALFTTREERRHADRLEEETSAAAQGEGGKPPEIASLTPPWLEVGRDPVEVQVTGEGFAPEAEVVLDGAPVETTWEDEGHLRFRVDGDRRAAKGALEVAVRSQGETSSVKRLPVTP